MKPFSLLAPAPALALLVTAACGQPATPPAPPQAPAEAAPTPGPHFIDMTATPLVLHRLAGDPDAATIRLDAAAADALSPDEDRLIEVMVSYDDDKTAWKAETQLDPTFEAEFAKTGVHARLLATRTTAYQREYWFAPDDDAALVRALRAIPQPTGAAIAVLRSNLDSLNSLRPTPEELAKVKPDTAH